MILHLSYWQKNKTTLISLGVGKSLKQFELSNAASKSITDKPSWKSFAIVWCDWRTELMVWLRNAIGWPMNQNSASRPGCQPGSLRGAFSAPWLCTGANTVVLLSPQSSSVSISRREAWGSIVFGFWDDCNMQPESRITTLEKLSYS